MRTSFLRKLTAVMLLLAPSDARAETAEIRIAEQYGVAFLPFLLEGVAGIESLNQRDGIHPTAQGARLVADNVWTVLRPVLEDRAGPK